MSRLSISANRRNSSLLHNLYKISATLCLFLTLALNLHSQVTVSANLTDATGATYRTAYLHFQLLNCGDNFPAVPSSPGLIIQDSSDIHPTLTTGLVTGTIIGNDQILCGNVASTWYQVTPMKDSSHPLRDGQPYVICASLTPSSSVHPDGGPRSAIRSSGLALRWGGPPFLQLLPYSFQQGLGKVSHPNPDDLQLS